MRTFTITRSQVAACPKGSLSPQHYKDDGTCLCAEKDARREAFRQAAADHAATGRRLDEARRAYEAC